MCLYIFRNTIRCGPFQYRKRVHNLLIEEYSEVKVVISIYYLFNYRQSTPPHPPPWIRP